MPVARQPARKIAAKAQNQPMSIRLPDEYEPLFVRYTKPLSATANASSPAKSNGRVILPASAPCVRWLDANRRMVMMTTSPAG